MSDRPSDWFLRQLPYTDRWTADDITDDHRRCLDVLGAITTPSGLYNLHTPCSTIDAFDLWPGGMSVLLRDELATFDFAELTRLVIRAHAHCVRVSIGPWLFHQDEQRAKAIAHQLSGDYGCKTEHDDPAVGVGVIQVMLTARDPSSTSTYDRHPDSAYLVESIHAYAVDEFTRERTAAIEGDR